MNKSIKSSVVFKWIDNPLNNYTRIHPGVYNKLRKHLEHPVISSIDRAKSVRFGLRHEID